MVQNPIRKGFVMKKSIVILVNVILFVSAINVSAREVNFDGKLGSGYSFYPERAGVSLTGSYQWVLDPFFAAGFESGIFWLKWEEQRGKELVGHSRSDLVATTNAYIIPVLGTVQIRFPNLREKIHVLPYATVGIGFSLMPLIFSDPEYTDNENVEHPSEKKHYLYSGFTWECLVGLSYAPTGSALEFLFDTGYVGSELFHNDNSIDTSRIVVNAGVRFAFGK